MTNLYCLSPIRPNTMKIRVVNFFSNYFHFTSILTKLDALLLELGLQSWWLRESSQQYCSLTAIWCLYYHLVFLSSDIHSRMLPSDIRYWLEIRTDRKMLLTTTSWHSWALGRLFKQDNPSQYFCSFPYYFGWITILSWFFEFFVILVSFNYWEKQYADSLFHTFRYVGTYETDSNFHLGWVNGHLLCILSWHVRLSLSEDRKRQLCWWCLSYGYFLFKFIRFTCIFTDEALPFCIIMCTLLSWIWRYFWNFTGNL